MSYPKLSNGDIIGTKGMVITAYKGRYQPPTYEFRRQMHHHEAQCRCGKKITRPEQQFTKKNPVQECPDCANLTKSESVKNYRNRKDTHSTTPKISGVKSTNGNLWPVPGN